MNVKVEALDQHKVKLTVEVEAAEVQKGFKRAVSDISGRINLKGFRKGKAPRKILEMYIGKEGLADEAQRIVANDTLYRAINDENLIPVTQPEVDTVKFSEEEGAVYTATFVKEPEVTLGQYKGLTASHEHPEITDDAVMEQLTQAAKQNARLEAAEEGAKLAKGDYAIIDFKGTVDGEAFAGGEGKTYPLEIGSESFIPGFEDQLIGHKAGDDVTVSVTFPEDYFVKDLAGKSAEFATHINDVKRKIVPEMNDEFAKSVSQYETLEELKNSLKQQMQLRAMQSAEEAYHNALVDVAVANAKVDIPAEMTDARIDEMIEEMKLNVEAGEGNFDDYLKTIGKTIEDLRKEYREAAEETVRQGLVLAAIAKAEDLKVTDRDLNNEIYSMAHQFGADPKDVVKIIRQENRVNMLIASVTRKKAAAYIYGAAKREDAKEEAAEDVKAEEKAEETKTDAE